MARISNKSISCILWYGRLLESEHLDDREIKRTPWSGALFEKLLVPQLINELPSFYDTWRFITVFTIAAQLYLP